MLFREELLESTRRAGLVAAYNAASARVEANSWRIATCCAGTLIGLAAAFMGEDQGVRAAGGLGTTLSLIAGVAWTFNRAALVKNLRERKHDLGISDDRLGRLTFFPQFQNRRDRNTPPSSPVQ